MPYIQNRGVKTFYESVGEGPPIVFMHGSFMDRTVWNHAGYIEGLKDYRCILVDSRGSGRSDKPRTLESYTVDEYAADVIAILDNLGIRRTIYWGYSIGGILGYAVASLHPDRISALVLTAAPCGFHSILDVESFINRTGTIGLAGWLEEYEKEEDIECPSWYKKMTCESNLEAWHLRFRAWDEWNFDAVSPARIDAPTLLVVGTKDWVYEHVSKDAERLPNSEVLRLEGEEHIGGLLRSDLVLPVVRDFLRSL